MKIQCLLLVGAAVHAAGFDILAALHGHGKKKHHHKKGKAAEDPTGIMGQIMAATSAGLADAEKAHDKAVKAARDQMTILLQHQVSTFSDAVKKLDADLQASAAVYGAAKESAQIAIEQAAAKKQPAGGNSWDLSPDQIMEARLTTQIGAADTALHKAERKRLRSLDEAVSRCDSLLQEDDGVRKITRKVGDLTEMLKEGVAPLDEVGKAAAANVPVQKNTSALLQKGQATIELKKAQDQLLAAKAQLEKSNVAAQKAFDSVFDKVAKDFGAALKDMLEGLDGEQKKELQTVRSASASIKMPEVKKKALVAQKHLRGKNVTATVMKNATQAVTKNATKAVATNATKAVVKNATKKA
jgi:hypothetical protein